MDSLVSTENGDITEIVLGGDRLVGGSMEYQYYVTDSWRAAIFADAGDAFDEGEFDAHYGVGLGAHFLSPVGAIRLELATDLSENSPSWRVGGGLELKKQSAQPLQLFGELNIIDGQIEALGQVLDIKKGSLSFVGAPDNPDLNIRAQREIPAEKIQVGLELLGALDAFTFNVYSTPAMPENEAMSYLIRGRGLDQGAQVDGTALALSVGLGAVNKIGLFEGLNKLPGVNNISFGTAGEAGDTTATVSAYLGERLYLSYGIVKLPWRSNA